MNKKVDWALLNKYLVREQNLGYTGFKWEKYFRDKVGWLVELTDGTVFCIQKPSIETDFCFGESGYDYEEAQDAAAEARTNENLFRIRNLRRINELIDQIKNPEPGYKLWVTPRGGVADWLNYGRDWQIECVNGATFEIGEEDRKRLLEGYEIVRDALDKRITTYLKKYGLTKVHSWTY